MTLDECMAADMTAPEASEASGVPLNAVRRWASKNGLRWRNSKIVPVSRGDREWPTMKDAARDLGVLPSTISTHLARHGNLDRVGLPRGPRPGTFVPSMAKPVCVGGHRWPSITAMARDLGISRHVATARLREGGERIIELVMARYAAAEKAAHRQRLIDADMTDCVYTRRAA